MKQETPTHTKIRFRRHEIADLSDLPSAEGQATHWRRGRRMRHMRRAWRIAVASLTFLIVVTVTTLYFVIGSGWGTDTLRMRAERTLQAAIGPGMRASVGPASMSLGVRQPVSVAFDGFGLSAADGKDAALHAGRISFGVHLVPLLTGNVRLGEASISNARIDVAALSARSDGAWFASLVDQRGLIDPDRVTRAVFAALQKVFDVVDRGLAEQIALSDIAIVLPKDGAFDRMTIVDATVTRDAEGAIRLSAALDVGGRSVALEGTAAREPMTRLVHDLDITITGAEHAIAEAEKKPPLQLGAFVVGLTGAERGPAQAKLQLDVKSDAIRLDFGARGELSGGLDLRATLADGSGKLEIDRLVVKTGRTVIDLNGAVGPKPDGKPSEPALYRFELLSNRSTLSPELSTEQALPIRAQVDGTIDPAAGFVDAQRIALTGGTGAATATARIVLQRGRAPGINFDLAAKDMPIAHAKQLWPWFAAGRTRQWVFEHVFGGRVRNGSIAFKVEPGRLGNGVPLSGEEVVGQFDIDGTRFDTAGLMPPVRGAVGRVDISGHDVGVALQSGTVYLPSGKSVAASNGRLDVRRAVREGRIGKLDIDVAGDASAIAELASFEPINALRRVAIEAQDLSGAVKGHVTAEIPLRKDVDRKTLDWHIALEYEDLAVAKPFAGQVLTEAAGTIDIIPDRVLLEAKGKLNGVPAEVKLVEPLRESGPDRDRDVTLVLDDAARRKLAPGLDALVSGTIRLDVDDEADGSRQVIADLTAAKLNIPWVGWSKGEGVGAAAQFTMRTADGRITLSDFSVTGETFSLDGDLTVAGGRLESAKFAAVRLNRGDKVRVDITGAGKGYAIKVTGQSLDARALIKKFLADRGGAGKQGASVPVTLSLDVASVTGFGDEVFDGVDLSVATSGGKLGAMSFSATTARGAAIRAGNTADDGRRTLRMESSDAGSVLRFLDLYPRMSGGTIKLALTEGDKGVMTGQVDARDFFVIDEPRLASLVSTTPPDGDRSLNQAVRRDIDTSRVQFDRGYVQLAKGSGFLRVANGVLRGPLIGTTFQGTLYDADGRMDMTGTFMPAYGINSLFGDIPVLGALLGNGRDGALIGVTYKLDGEAKSPRLSVNPLSIIAPGIFRSIFEF